MLLLSNNAYNVLKSLGIFISILFRILDYLNHIQLPLFMLITLIIALFRRFLCFHCLTNLVICLNPYFIFISIIFRIVESLNHIHLLLFVLRKVSIAILKQLLCFHCLTKLIICLKPLVIFISILFRNLQSLNRIQLPLFMFITLSIALLSRILCFHCLTKTVICLNP